MSNEKSFNAVAEFADALSFIAVQLKEANQLGNGRVEAIKDILLETGLLTEDDASRLVNR